ncbi:HAD family hydrolase [Loigolactobacillus binensis]|uniref:HAD family hydrolase n=1 Tax=Loigolactobacillus binensis TaxID=2559922 RepID=A0ABW3EFK2_9LACO|nr:HAD family phosphatase [Loigolactobacillus binensis]
MNIQAVIFDMDGVILDSEPQIIEAKQQVLHKYGIDQPETYHYKFMGMSFQAIWQQIQRELNLPVTWQELLDDYFAKYQALIAQSAQHPITGSVELVKSLNHAGYKLALASSSPIADIQRTLDNFGITDCFATVISGYTLAHPKPAPDIFQMAMQQLNVMPENSIVVEDSMNGIKAGLAAGAQVIGYNDPRYYAQRKVADVRLVTKMQQIQELLLPRE